MSSRHHSHNKTTLGFVLKRLWHEGIVARVDKYRYLEPTTPLPLDKPAPEGLRFEPITHENVARIVPWKGRLHAWRFRILLNRGYVGLYAILNDDVVGYLWSVPKLHRWAPGCLHDVLEVDEVLGGRMEIRPDMRRRNIGMHARARLQQVLAESFGKKLRYTWGTVLVENTPMQRMVERLGFIKHELMRTYVILGHLYIHLLWSLDETGAPIGRPRVVIRPKLPDIFFIAPIAGQRQPTLTTPKRRPHMHTR
nr:GNAT family N-acetyltransferase [Ardenticatena sp.]